VLLAAGFGGLLFVKDWTKSKLSPGSAADLDFRIERAWQAQQKSIGTHGYQSDEYNRLNKIWEELKAEREAKFGKKF
jgi:hypothetical protein